MNELALFAGAGGGILGTHLLGWRCVAAVEVEDYPRRVLLQRQADGVLPRFPIWDDVCTFDGKPWRGKVDVVSGGFPCQDISSAGKGAGIEGERSGLWGEMARIISEVQPRYVWVENSPLLVSRGLGLVLLDLAKMGYDARWGIVGAHHVAAPHKRDRCWIVAYSNKPGSGHNEKPCHKGWSSSKTRGKGIQPKNRETYPSNIREGGADVSCPEKLQRNGSDNITGECMGGRKISKSGDSSRQDGIPNAPSKRLEGHSEGIPERGRLAREDWWATESGLGRVANGVANRVDRLKAIGNGQVPAVVQLAWEILSREN